VPDDDGSITRLLLAGGAHALLHDRGLEVDWVRPRRSQPRRPSSARLRAGAAGRRLRTLVETEVALGAGADRARPPGCTWWRSATAAPDRPASAQPPAASNFSWSATQRAASGRTSSARPGSAAAVDARCRTCRRRAGERRLDLRALVGGVLEQGVLLVGVGELAGDVARGAGRSG
jgi:hypothetical protein